MHYSDWWRFASEFDLHEASALFCESEPRQFGGIGHHDKAYRAIRSTLKSAVQKKQLATLHPSEYGNPHALPPSFSREDLTAWATSEGLQPSFLFPASPNLPRQKRGRPRVYDWDAMTVEVVRIADIDGLPSTATELVTRAMKWFEETHGQEPAVSEVRKRIDGFYRALRQQGWEPSR